MGNGKSDNCTPEHPCKVCGKPDWCNYVTFPNGEELAYCQRIHGNEGETTIAVDGRAYICKKNTSGGFTVWELFEQYEANRQAFIKAKYPGGKTPYKRTYKMADNKAQAPAVKRSSEVSGVSSIQSPEILDKVYRELLDMLVLEDKHEKKLRAEWDQMPGVYESIMSSFPIRSLPPEDKLRFSSHESLKNLSRKKIMEKLVERCGRENCLGVPGIYERNDGALTLHPLCGIVYPEYDSMGRIIRLRIGLDYPQVKGQYNGMDGRFSYRAIDNTAGWYFFADDSNNPVLVWEHGSPKNLIELNSKGYPAGKTSGKYMNFTSYKEAEKRLEDGSVVRFNKYKNGCESSSFISLYSSPENRYEIVYITEGEKKAMVANKILGVPVISIPGVNSFRKLFEAEVGSDRSMVDNLIAKGTQGFVLVYDADKSVNEAVLHNEQGAIEEFKKRNLAIAIGEWNANWGKGLDDVLLTGVMPDVHFIK